MRSVYASLAALLIGVAALVAGQGLLNTTAALTLDDAGVPGVVLAGVLATYFLGWIAGCLGVPRLLARVGHIRTFAALGGIACASSLLHGLLAPPWPWLVLRLASGFCMAGLLLTTENWLTLRAPPEVRGRVLAGYLIVFHVALAAGQGVLTQTGAHGALPFMAAAVLIALAAVPTAATRTEAPVLPPASRMSVRRLVRTARTALATAFLSGLLVGGYQTLGPVYVVGLGLDVEAVGLWMAAVVLGGLALQWPTGWLSDRIDRRLLTTVVCLGITGACAGLWAAPAALVPQLLIAAAFGSLVALLYPLALAHGNDRVPAEESLALGTTLVLVAGLGAFAGPLLATPAMARFGPGGLFASFGACAGLLAVFHVVRMLRRGAPTAAQSEPYVAVPRTTAGVVQLDPRVLEEDRVAAAEPEDLELLQAETDRLASRVRSLEHENRALQAARPEGAPEPPGDAEGP